MEWTQISIFTSAKGIDIVCDMLSGLGIDGVEIEDEQDFKDFLEENRKYWDYVDDDLMREKAKETCVKIYLEADDTFEERKKEIENALLNLKKEDEKNEWGRLALDTATLYEEDWANNWKQYFHPIEVGEKILIQPSWEEIEGETDRIVFTVNPGMTFGTGTHHTTKLCIEELEKSVGSDSVVLDLGCGSGILSIISLLLGAKEAYAVDIDPACEHVAKENAVMNGVNLSKYHIYSGDVTGNTKLFETLNVRKYDVIVANIVADVIIAILPTVKKLIKENGVFICSGIIEERLDDVKNAMTKEGIDSSFVKYSGGWCAISTTI